MEDLIFKLWPYFEQAGIVAAVIMSAWLWDTRRTLKETRDELREWQKLHDLAQKSRIDDSKTALPLIEKNTAETKTLIDLVRSMTTMLSSMRGGS